MYLHFIQLRSLSQVFQGQQVLRPHQLVRGESLREPSRVLKCCWSIEVSPSVSRFVYCFLTFLKIELISRGGLEVLKSELMSEHPEIGIIGIASLNRCSCNRVKSGCRP